MPGKISAIFERGSVVESTEGESKRGAPPAVVLLLAPFRLVFVLLLAALLLPLWPVYGLGRIVYGRAPNVPRGSQITRYLRLAWTVRPPPPGLGVAHRVWLTVSVLRKAATMPLWGVAWYLDELLYGRKLDGVKVERPLFELSAARSGSTQFAHYLEEDPNLVAPSFLQGLFPFRWLWRLAAMTLGRVVKKEKVRDAMTANLPPEWLQRHEFDPFAIDTFEIPVYIGRLNNLSPLFGPGPAIEDFTFAEVGPTNQKLWREDFPAIVDRMARKLLIDDSSRRFFIKGHFLAAADVLEARYPDASFVAIVREPAARIRSHVNYLRASAFDPALPPAPWAWMAELAIGTEIAYCDLEMQWYRRAGQARRCVIPFSEYRDDLEGALKRMYRECFDTEVPPEVPTEHAPRVRTEYLVNRSLEELGIDRGELDARCADYIAWCGAPSPLRNDASDVPAPTVASTS